MTTPTNPQTLPQAMQQISASVQTATRDLLAAANELRAFLGLDPVEVPVEAAPSNLAEMLADLRKATRLTTDGADDLSFAVATFLGTRYQTATPPQTATPEPTPIVAPTLAGLPARTIADQAEQEANIHEQIAETQDAEPERIEVAVIRDPEPNYTTEPALPPVDDERDLEGEEITRRAWEEEQEAEANAEKAAAERFAEEIEREADTHRNGHVPQGEELQTVGADPTTETPTRKGRGKGRGRGRS